MNDLGPTLIKIGGLLLLTGALFAFLPHYKLPGDIFWQRGNFSIYFPITTMIIISIVLSIIVNLRNSR